MSTLFVPYELAVKLKELGFDEDCLTCYCKHWKDLEIYLWKINQPDYGNYWDLNSKVEAPLWQQAFDWFREKHNLSYCVAFNGSESYYWWITECKEFGLDINSIDELDFFTYQEARQACLEKLIELVENK